MPKRTEMVLMNVVAARYRRPSVDYFLYYIYISIYIDDLHRL